MGEILIKITSSLSLHNTGGRDRDTYQYHHHILTLNAPRTVFQNYELFRFMIMSRTAPENNGIYYTVSKVPLQPIKGLFLWDLLDQKTGVCLKISELRGQLFPD